MSFFQIFLKGLLLAIVHHFRMENDPFLIYIGIIYDMLGKRIAAIL